MKKFIIIFFSRLLLAFIILILIKTNLYCQIKSEIDKTISNNKIKSRAEHALKTGDLYTALFYYEELIKKDSTNLENRFKIAELHRLTRNYKKAIPAYDYVAKRGAALFPIASYYRAVMKKMTGNYKDAKEEMLTFKKENKNYGSKDFKKLLTNEIAGCDSGQFYFENPNAIFLENSGSSVNHPHTEFSPLQIDSINILFGSLREDSVKFYNNTDEFKEPKPFRQIFKATRKNDQWIENGKFTAINDTTMEMGNFTYSQNTKRYYFTKCKKSEKGKIECKIYYTQNENGNWTNPVILPDPINLNGFTSTQPAISIDTLKVKSKPVSKNTGVKKNVKNTPIKEESSVKNILEETLYFVSDRPEGKGETDIWYSTFNTIKNVWSLPVNISSINTSETECTPFYDIKSKKLFFSSNGLINAGGLDIFKTDKIGKKFTAPENLKFPLNSSQDDLGYVISENGSSGFLVSNRVGGTPFFHETCCDDIYQYDYSKAPIFEHLLILKIESNDSISCLGKKLSINVKNLISGKDSTAEYILKDCNFKLKLSKDFEYSFNYELKHFRHDSLIVRTPIVAKNTITEKVLLLIPSKTDTGTFPVTTIVKQQKDSLITTTIIPKDKISIEKTTESDTSKREISLNIPLEIKTVKPLDTLRKHKGLDVIEGKSFILKGVEYATDSFNLTEKGKTAIDSLLIPLLNDRPDDILLFGSHTDNHGSHPYNVKLSNKRAEQVTKYLIEKGILKIRISGKGYGETQPMAPNEFPDGKDNPEGRRQNRRTEFMLLKP